MVFEGCRAATRGLRVWSTWLTTVRRWALMDARCGVALAELICRPAQLCCHERPTAGRLASHVAVPAILDCPVTSERWMEKQ
eukprot:3613380-Pyramimonas_sp.AAC.1